MVGHLIQREGSAVNPKLSATKWGMEQLAWDERRRWGIGKNKGYSTHKVITGQCGSTCSLVSNHPSSGNSTWRCLRGNQPLLFSSSILKPTPMFRGGASLASPVTASISDHGDWLTDEDISQSETMNVRPLQEILGKRNFLSLTRCCQNPVSFWIVWHGVARSAVARATFLYSMGEECRTSRAISCCRESEGKVKIVKDSTKSREETIHIVSFELLGLFSLKLRDCELYNYVSQYILGTV